MIKRVKSSVWIELPKTLEGDNAEKICESPYEIERTEEDSIIIWWGLKTNWKMVDGKWYHLIDMEFVECEEPEYEKIYKSLL